MQAPTLHTASLPRACFPRDDAETRRNHLLESIEHAARLLPTQGPISVFVYHNTLQAFEDDHFDVAAAKGIETYGCQPYLSEQRYREELTRGRILRSDIADVLIEDLGEGASHFIGFMGTRYHLRLAMLEHPLLHGSDAEVRWLIAETDALNHFREEAPETFRRELIRLTRQWLLDEHSQGFDGAGRRFHETVDHVLKELGVRSFDRKSLDSLTGTMWESITLNLLWQVCRQGAHGIPPLGRTQPAAIRHRDALLQATGDDLDLSVNELLIRFCSAFLDQGFAPWPLPGRELGFFGSFITLFRDSRPLEHWLTGLPAELRRIERAGLGPLESIDESLEILGVDNHERDEYIAQTLLALRGWAGMIWQMETNAEWTVRPAPKGSLAGYLAVRLLLERMALTNLAQPLNESNDLTTLRIRLVRGVPQRPMVSVDQRAYMIFQLAQVRGWSPADLYRLSKESWKSLVHEMELFSDVERRRIYHLAYERAYRDRALSAIAAHRPWTPASSAADKSFQLMTCIDDREESFRRHIEEIDPRCETFGAPGFFAIPIYYRGAADAHYRPLSPVMIKPRHYVAEEAAYSLQVSSRQRAGARRALGAASHQWHLQSRTILGGFFTALLGSLASIPMLMRILFPGTTARIGKLCGSFIQPPANTELILTRTDEPPGPEPGHIGFTIPEMAGSVDRVLRDSGLTRDFARIVIVLGHGSSSLNNPHASAYDCGACSGGRGGPNARSFAQMANNHKVRAILKERGLDIPESTIFVGGFHNTCNEDVILFDLDRIPVTHRAEFEKAVATVTAARERNAHERCRRFESADLRLTTRAALEHVQTRAEDLSQARVEYDHATNAMCFVGRRIRTRGLFLDRRAFLNDYDPTQDDAESTILARILSAAVPVCGGISLQYYFSCVDVGGYGCGSKLPLNIVSLLGVMEGAASDLRPGLSQQMTEIHEPMRILFLVETTPQAMLSIMDRNASIGRLVRNEWVQLAVLDPQSSNIQIFSRGEFLPYHPKPVALPQVASSVEWYHDRRDHLGVAVISRNTRRES